MLRFLGGGRPPNAQPQGREHRGSMGSNGRDTTSGRQQENCSSIVQICLVIGITGLLWGFKNFITYPYEDEWTFVLKWLERENLSEHNNLFWRAGETIFSYLTRVVECQFDNQFNFKGTATESCFYNSTKPKGMVRS